MIRCYIALVHWPILSKSGEIVSTTVTHFDIHDIARASKTYGIKKYYIVHSVREQLMYVARVLDHWKLGEGSGLNLARQKALALIDLKESIEKACEDIEKIEGSRPLVVSTAARSIESGKNIGFKPMRCLMPEKPVLILFGTGYGLAPEVLDQSDYLLEPLKGASVEDYRHLSVRSAVSICLDRLLGSW